MAFKTGRECGVVGVSSGVRYTILLHGHFCSCQYYQYNVMQVTLSRVILVVICITQGKEVLYCKHLLALKLGLLMDKAKVETVSDERVRLLLEELA